MTGGFQSSIQIPQQSVLDGNVQTLPLCLIVDSPLVREEKLQLSLHHCLYHFLAPDLIVFSLRLVSTKHSLISFNSSRPISAVGDDGDDGGDGGDGGGGMLADYVNVVGLLDLPAGRGQPRT